jgi:3-oxoacyl-[acyl-carrier protein] reductase
VKRVLVTGASRGIGRATAVRLARAGFSVVLNCHRNVDAARDVAASITAVGGDAIILPFDVAARDVCARVLAEDIEQRGPYYGAVCNAGAHADAPFPALSGQAWDDVVRTNLDGFYNVLHPLVMPMVQARQGGRIVTMSSVAALAGNRGQVNYSAAKAGLIGATRALARELAKRAITVNSVAPGLIDTDMLSGAPVQQLLEIVPMRRLGTPEEVAATVGFLFSEDAGYITGQVISVNGGLH